MEGQSIGRRECTRGNGFGQVVLERNRSHEDGSGVDRIRRIERDDLRPEVFRGSKVELSGRAVGSRGCVLRRDMTTLGGDLLATGVFRSLGSVTRGRRETAEAPTYERHDDNQGTGEDAEGLARALMDHSAKSQCNMHME
jgi:hypothetical protein